MLTLLFHVAISGVRAAEPEEEALLPIAAVVSDDAEDDDDDDEARGYTEIAASIGLSEAQTAKVKEIVYASRVARIDQKAKAAKAKLELKQLLTASSFDEKNINRALESYIAAEGELQRSKIKLLLDLRKQLDEKQWASLVAMREERRSERREERRERREERRGD